jgi:glycosyltransferase involved in cell wall biosynthesis
MSEGKGELLVILPTDRVGGAERVMKTLLSVAARDFDSVQILILARGRSSGFWEDVAPNVIVNYLHAEREVTGAVAAGKWLFHNRKHDWKLTLTTHIHCNALVSMAHRLGWLRCDHVFRESSSALRYGRFARRMMAHFYYWLYIRDVPCICQTELMRGDLLQFSRFAKHWKSAVIPNPIDAERVQRLAEGPNPAPVPAGARYVVGVGWLRPDKQFDTLIRAFALFASWQGETWYLCIAGEGSERARLEALIREKRLEGRVYLLGQVANPYPLMRGASMGVVSSRVEGFPNVLLEMMALCPAVASTLCAGGVEKLSGIETCAPEDANALAEAMQRAFNRYGGEAEAAMRREVEARSPASFWASVRSLVQPLPGEPSPSEQHKKRVLHVITGLNQGGAENVLCRLVEALKDRVDFHIVSMMDGGDYGAKLRELGATVSTLGMKRGAPSFGAFFKLRRLMKEWKPDVVQTWMYHADLLGGIAAKSAGVRRIVWGIRHSELGPGDSRMTRVVARIDALLSRWVPDAIVSCSERAAEYHVKMGYRASILSVIPNGYPLGEFTPDARRRAAFREKLGISPETVVFGNASRYDPQKDHAALVKAFGMLKKSRPYSDILLLLCGRNVDEKNMVLALEIRENNVVDRVKLLGKQADMPSFMNAVDFLVLSSSHGEAFPNVVAEAMACGRPCIATDVGDAGCIVGGTGWIVPPADPEMLAGAMLDALREDEALLQERERAARERVVHHYGIETMAEMYITVWDIR